MTVINLMASLPRRFLSPEQYLEAERKASYKSEYVNGEVFAMAGASEAHVQAMANLFRVLGNQTLDRCRVLGADMRVHVPATGLYTYPDIAVTCEKAQFISNELDTLINPRLIVEVLSPSTEAWDRGEKFHHHQSIPSFVQYLLVSTRKPFLELFTRNEQGAWTLSYAQGLESSLELSSVGATLALADVYRHITFDAQASPLYS